MSRLAFLNRDEFASETGHIFEMQDGQPDLFNGEYHSGLTISVRAASLAFGGPEPFHPLPGTQAAIRVVSVSGPEGAHFSLWEGLSEIPLWTASTTTQSNEDIIWLVSENEGLAGQDPFGHIHGRRFSASIPGFYTLTIEAQDLSSNGPDGGANHLPSELLSIRFKAGDPEENPSPEPDNSTYFEGRLTHPIAIHPDGNLLFAVNNEENRVSVFALAADAALAPALIAEIPVGLSPVSVRLRGDKAEAWVVNEVSDSISIISLDSMMVIDTLYIPDEPADLVFAGDKVFVTCSRDNTVKVLSVNSRTEVSTIELKGLMPRNLCVSPDKKHVYTSFLHSGNGTTVVPGSPDFPQSAPANPDLPPPPVTARIVSTESSNLDFQVLDNDIAEINVDNLNVSRYFGGLGTCYFDLNISADQTSLSALCTEAFNQISFENNLQEQFIENRLVTINLQDGDSSTINLSEIRLFPASPISVGAMAQPMNILPINISPEGGWIISAFGSDRLLHLNSAQSLVSQIDLRLNTNDRYIESTVRGPRGLAVSSANGLLYTLNKLSRSISIIDLVSGIVVGEVPLTDHDSIKPEFLEGRGILYDARLSGDGNSSCGSCHIDGDRDGLAWDLGVPDGEMMIVQGANLSAHSSTPRNRELHPMKGPMTTQTLWGLDGGAPFHWRGDMPTLESFNRVFPALLGGSELDAESLARLSNYLLSIDFHPNPYRNTDNSMRVSVEGGDPYRGEFLFNLHANHCGVCHAGPRGSDNNLDLPHEVGSTQPVKNPHLRTVYQRRFFNPRPGAESLTGFGLGKDGTGFSLPIVHPYVLHELFEQRDFRDVAAFVLSFDTGTPASTGRSITANNSNSARIRQSGQLDTFIKSAREGLSDLVVFGRFQGHTRAFVYMPEQSVFTDAVLGDVSFEELTNNLTDGDSLTWMCVPFGSGFEMLFDRNRDGEIDRLHSIQTLGIKRNGPALQLILKAQIPGISIWQTSTPDGDWHPVFRPLNSPPHQIDVTPTPQSEEVKFFRIKSTSY